MAEADRTVPFYQTVEGYILPGGFSAEAFKSALKYVPRDDDFFIATYPKCGTTWAQQIVYLIYNEGKPAGSRADFFLRTPFLEMSGIESAERMTRPGAIKVHLPFRLAPYSEKAKYLCVVRNPKDVVVSFYHHMITDPVFTFQEGTFDRFFEDFVSGKIAFGDYFGHVLGWYEHRNDPNVMFITYEEMKRDTRSSVLKISKFMGKKWFELLQNNQEILENVLKYSRIDFMKTLINMDVSQVKKIEDDIYPGTKHVMEFTNAHHNKTDKEFQLVRSGRLGDWRTVLSEDQVQRLNMRIEKEMKGTYLYTYWNDIGCI